MEHHSCIFRFADVELDESNFSVTKADKVLPLEPKVFKVLQFLLHHPGRVVTKDELLDAVWSDTSVSESSLTRSVTTLRRLLGDDIHEPRYIATIPTVGYRSCAMCASTMSRSNLPSHPSLESVPTPWRCCHSPAELAESLRKQFSVGALSIAPYQQCSAGRGWRRAGQSRVEHCGYGDLC